MGILAKFQDPQATKELEDELKSKVGIQEQKKIGDGENSAGIQPRVEQPFVEQVTIGEEEREPAVEAAMDGQAQRLVKKNIRKPSTKKGEPNQENVLPPVVEEQFQGDEIISQDLEKLEAFIKNYKKSYNQSAKENRMLRMQQKNYEKLLKLKLGKVNISKFVNFAVAFTLNSKHYKHIVKLLNQPKDG